MRIMRPFWMSFASAAALILVGCGGPQSPAAPEDRTASNDTAADTAPITAQVTALQMHVLDCGTIDISDLDVFSTEGDYAGQSDTFTDTCWLIEHPNGRLLWDLGLPSMLAGIPPQENGIFTVSMQTTLTDQLADLGLGWSDIERITISHAHFDHIGQIDQVSGPKWLVHEDEYNAMFPPPPPEGEEDTAADAPIDMEAMFAAFGGLEREIFTGEYDVFGDGNVIIFETPGHTAGHTSLQVNLPETGPVLLTGDLYHRSESRALKRVPKFNFDIEQSRASIDVFEARAKELGAKVIIQHEKEDIEALPKLMK